MRYFSVLLAVLMLAGLPSEASARDKGYKWHLDRGEALYNSGKYIEAFEEFGRAKEAGRKRELSESELSRIDFYQAVSAQRAGKPDAGVYLTWFIEQYPTSVYAPQANYALGSHYFESGQYRDAIAAFGSFDSGKLAREDREALNFKLGYSFFNMEEYDRVYEYMGNVDFRSDYYTHAQYVLGYSSYREGKYDSAKKYFSDIAQTEAYGAIVPFYLLQIEFTQGNYYYVTENGPAVLRMASGEQKTEMTRIIGESYFHTHQWDEALQFMEEYSRSGGQMGRIENYIVGYSHYMNKQYTNAELYLAKVPGQDDLLSQNASYHLGDVYLRMGDKHRALQSFSIASTEGYDDTISEDALFNYGKLQYEQGGGYFNEAVNVLNRYLALYPSSPRASQVKEYLVAAYYNSNNFEAAYQAIMQMPDPDNNIRAALQRITYFRALECFNIGDYTGAWALFDESLRNRYNAKYTALSGYWQGEILYRTGNYAGAAQKYNSYINLSPKSEPENMTARYNLGYCYFNLKDWAKSREWFDNFLIEYKKNDRFMADANNRRGDIEYTNRSFWRAIEYYDKALRVNSDEKYYSQYQRAMTQGMLDRPDRKAEGMQAIVTKGDGPYVDDAMYQLGKTYIVQQKFREGAEILESFIVLYPDSSDNTAALADLGLVYQNLNDQTKALAYYKKVVDREKHSEVARDAMNGIRSIYVDRNDVDAYFRYARTVGIETDLGVVQRDSITYASAYRAYSSADKESAARSLANYVSGFPRGAYVANALYYQGEIALSQDEKPKAMDFYTRLTGMYHNDYTVRGLERVATVGMELQMYEAAADAYDRLSRSTGTSIKRDDALAGYMSALILQGDLEKIVAGADSTLERAQDKNLIRETMYTKAIALNEIGRKDEAFPIFSELSADVSTSEGAEAAYRVIEARYDAGENDEVEKLVYAFAQKNSPYAYWLGKAFLTLGDIYTARGDAFQARATYQSVVDGYPNREDGIIEEATARIRDLK